MTPESPERRLARRRFIWLAIALGGLSSGVYSAVHGRPWTTLALALILGLQLWLGPPQR